MIQSNTRLRCADNSGAKELMCIQVVAGSNKAYGGVGDIIVCAVKEATPGAPVKKGEVVRAVIVRTTKEFSRPDGSQILGPPSPLRERGSIILRRENHLREEFTKARLPERRLCRRARSLGALSLGCSEEVADSRR